MGNSDSAIEIDTRPWLDVEQRGRTFYLTVGGSWTVRHAAILDPQLRALEAGHASDVEIDASGIDRLDSTGGWLLVRTKMTFEAAGIRVPVFKTPELYTALLASIEREHITPPVSIEERVTLAAFLERIGRATHNVAIQAVGIIGYLGHVTLEWLEAIYAPRGNLRVTAIVHQIEEVGINALPIVGLLMFLIGIVLAYQGADQLKRFDLEILTIN
ncbi:MAG: STAS domain-containing protein, partial [Alphaproteobacteria bacterium]|nr:STAS domain-containing protein [Alphaproteobacteria bacterium]